MAGLLVSVRSVAEAQAALSGGAEVIDIKEPTRGPLGRADEATWRAVRAEVAGRAPVSAALGELIDWDDPGRGADLDGLAYCKLGLAGVGPDWEDRWARLRGDCQGAAGWVAVVYADWAAARSPDPPTVLAAALRAGCVGVLVDTWDKSRASPLVEAPDPWADWIDQARRAGLRVALAGGLDQAAIARLAPLRPDLFAVRGAACQAGQRDAPIDPERVAGLVRVAHGAND